jgi:serine/threonine protein kinase
MQKSHDHDWQRVFAAAAISPSNHVLRLLDVALMWNGRGQTAIALIYPHMDSTLRTWCLPDSRSLAPQEYRHIAWSILLGITHLHSIKLVHADLTPCNVQLKGAGFGDSAIDFAVFGDDRHFAGKYFEKAASL